MGVQDQELGAGDSGHLRLFRQRCQGAVAVRCDVPDRTPDPDNGVIMIDHPATEPPVMPDVLAAFGLPGKITGIEPVCRAWSNRVFRVRTTAADYAIKQLLNP